jgi:hypothetical protein
VALRIRLTKEVVVGVDGLYTDALCYISGPAAIGAATPLPIISIKSFVNRAA